MVEQKILFERVKAKIPDGNALADEMEDLLGMSKESVYRRIRGETLLTLEDLAKITTKYQISVDEIFNIQPDKGVLFQYHPVDISNIESNAAYMTHLLKTMEVVAKSPLEKELIFSAQDIPFYHFCKFPYLAFLRLYTWNNTLDRNKISYDKFCENLDKDKIVPIYERMYQTYISIPTREIWTEHTIDSMIRLIDYFYEAGNFDSKDTVLFLLDRLSSLIDTIKQYADEGYKTDTQKTPFHFHVCSVDLESNFMLMQRGKQMSLILQMYAINRIVTENELLCSEAKKWVNSLISKSILISGEVAFKERFQFFQGLKNKIQELINKVMSKKGN